MYIKILWHIIKISHYRQKNRALGVIKVAFSAIFYKKSNKKTIFRLFSAVSGDILATG